MNEDHKKFLNELRKSGKVNMFGASNNLQLEFGLDKYEARKILSEWMKSFQDHDNSDPDIDDQTYPEDIIY